MNSSVQKTQKIATVAGLLVLAGALLAGIGALLQMRFRKGDVYPPYSTYRSDPLGTRILFESFHELPGVRAVRAVEPPDRLPYPREATVFVFANYRESVISEDILVELENHVARGGRLVLTFQPSGTSNWIAPSPETDESEDEDEDDTADDPEGADNEEGRAEKEHEEQEAAEVPVVRTWTLQDVFTNRWDITILPRGGRRHTEARPVAPAYPRLKEPIPSHARLRFEPENDAWRTVYEADGHAVVAEKPMGDGTVVLCAGSYVFSNEAMRTARRPEFLAWTAGATGTVVFEETHFGFYRTDNVMMLIRKYRFHWFIAAVFVLAILFVWQNAFPRVPVREEDGDRADEPSRAKGRMTTQGLTALLQRSVPRGELLKVCTDMWREKAAEWERSATPEQQQRLQQLLARIENGEPGKDPAEIVNAYREISRTLTERKIS